MNNFKIHYFVIAIIAFLSAAIIGLDTHWSGHQESQLKRILSRKELRVSVISSPLIYVNDKNEISGFDYELAQHFADYLGVKLKVTVRPTINQLFDDLKKDKADLVAAGLLYNQDRLKNAQAGPQYLSVSQQLIYRKGTTRPKSFDQVNGKFVVMAGSAHARTLKQLKQFYPELSWQETNDYSTHQLLEMVAEGIIDYTLEDSISVSLQQRIHPQAAIAFDLGEENAITWYMERTADDSLNAALLDFFNASNEEELLARLEEKYFSHVSSFDYFDTLTFISAINKVLPDYRPLFEKYAHNIDWRLLAAIAWQESHWDPQATSPTGVRGLMMLTKPTAATMGVQDRLDPEESIKGGAAYIEYIMQRLPVSIPDDERIWFALAAYNMGYGHMLDVRKLTEQQGGDPNRWLDVKSRLPLLTQKKYYTQLNYGYARGHEAYRYVENIRRYQQSLVGYLYNQENKPLTEPNELQARLFAPLDESTSSALIKQNSDSNIEPANSYPAPKSHSVPQEKVSLKNQQNQSIPNKISAVNPENILGDHFLSIYHKRKQQLQKQASQYQQSHDDTRAIPLIPSAEH